MRVTQTARLIEAELSCAYHGAAASQVFRATIRFIALHFIGELFESNLGRERWPLLVQDVLESTLTVRHNTLTPLAFLKLIRQLSLLHHVDRLVDAALGLAVHELIQLVEDLTMLDLTLHNHLLEFLYFIHLRLRSYLLVLELLVQLVDLVALLAQLRDRLFMRELHVLNLAFLGLLLVLQLAGDVVEFHAQFLNVKLSRDAHLLLLFFELTFFGQLFLHMRQVFEFSLK